MQRGVFSAENSAVFIATKSQRYLVAVPAVLDIFEGRLATKGAATRLTLPFCLFVRDIDPAIDKSVQAHLKNVLSKDLTDFGKIKQEKAAKQSMPKYSTKPFDEASLKEYDLKDKLIKLLMKSKRHDDQDPPTGADKETKKRKKKDSDALSLKKIKDKEESSKGTKASSGPSPTQKAVDGDELIQDGAMDDTEMAQDDDMVADDMLHDDDSPIQDRSKWFKQDVVVRPETPDPKWHKEPNADDVPE
ncbi:hypothetical protein Tco_1236900 [Tanacetum coccineum]